MIKGKLLFALAVVMALAGCQQPGGSTRQSAVMAEDDPLAEALESEVAKQEKDYKPSPFFKTKVKDLMVEMMDRMLSKCIDADGKAEMEECFHERLLAGFDRDGTLERHCVLRDDLGADMKCIMFGGMGQQIGSKLHEDDAVAFDWAAPEQSAKGVMQQLVLEQIRNCFSSGAASDPFDCFMGRITASLGLTSANLEPCAPMKDDDVKFGNCVGEVFAYAYMSAGVERM
jgi:hypothetical protein